MSGLWTFMTNWNGIFPLEILHKYYRLFVLHVNLDGSCFNTYLKIVFIYTIVYLKILHGECCLYNQVLEPKAVVKSRVTIDDWNLLFKFYLDLRTAFDNSVVHYMYQYEELRCGRKGRPFGH